MIQKTDLKGNTIKKGIGAHRIAQRWHNKNKRGGNFGINIYYAEEFNRATDREITGYYNTEGNITNLNFGFLYSAGGRVPESALESLETLFSWIKEYERRGFL